MGYYIDEQQYYQIDPKTAPVVLEMFTRYSEGATMQVLVNLLNSRGMRSIHGGKITLNIMNHLLKNRRYMGEYSYRDVVKEDGIPAIVPKDLFERVQERLAKNKKAPARHKAEDDYLLTTKLYCGKCGSFMVGESGTSHTMKVHRYYRCVNTKKKKLCDKKAVKKDWIEDLVVSYTMKAIMNDEVMERLIDTLMELQKKVLDNKQQARPQSPYSCPPLCGWLPSICLRSKPLQTGMIWTCTRWEKRNALCMPSYPTTTTA